MGPRYINYSREVKGFRSFMDQNIRLVFPGESQTVEERSPICSPLPSLATPDPGDLSLSQDVEPSLTGPGPVEDLAWLATTHLQSLVKERAVWEEVLTREIPGLSSSSSSEVKVGHSLVEQLLEDAREEQERIFSLTEKVELLTGVTQSRRLCQALESWQEDIREIYHATTTNQDISSCIRKMIGTIRTIRTIIWTFASTSPKAI